MDPVDALLRFHGAARCGQLRGLGVTQRSLTAAVATGRVLRPDVGLYAVGSCSPARLAAAAVGGVPSCADALEELAIAVLGRDARVHVRAARGTRREWPGAEVHRTGLPTGSRLEVVDALVSLAHCAPPAVAVGALDQALRERRCTWAQLLTAGGRRDPSWRRVLSLVDARAMSGLESLARVELVEGLAGRGVSVEVQVVLDGVGAVDLLVDGWIIVETDGFAFHADRDSYRRDRFRDAVAAASGYAHLRLTYETVVRRDGSVLLFVDQVLQRGRPPHWHSLRRGSADQDSA